jgi:uncharacterized protein (TIGR02145 family)/uncharacterized repeat protein (TIGR02543 family)
MQRQCINKYGLVFLGTLIFLLLCVKNITSPYDPSNTTISAVLRSSSMTILNESAYIDSTGSLVRIGVTSNLPMNIDSVTISVHSAITNSDTVFTLNGLDSLKSSDTAWSGYVFKNEGNHSLSVEAYVKNGKKLSITFQIIIYSRPVNHKPKLSVTGRDSVVSGELCSLYVAAIDTDMQQTLDYSIENKPFGATFNQPFFKWPTPLNFSAIDTIVFIVTDNGYPPLSDTQKAIITVFTLKINQPPKWEQDTLRLDATPGQPMSFDLSGKCIDPDGDTIAYSLLGGLPESDTVIGATYAFTPSARETGSVYPRIAATDSKGGLDTVTLRITISSANKKPVFKTGMPKSLYAINEGDLLSIPLGASDADNDSIFFFVQTSATTLPRLSTIALKKDTLTWQSQNSDTGNFKVGIGATDKKDTVYIDVNVSVGNVNHPPMWTHRSIAADVQEGKTLTLVLSDSCADSDGDMIHYTLSAGAPQTDSIVSLNRYTYAPGYADSGAYTVKIIASDGKLTDTLTIKLHVVNVNRPPVIAGLKDTTIMQGATIDFTATATDPDGDKVTLSAGTLPSGATFNTTSGAFHWSPASALTGGTDITFTASDGSLQASKTITITISNMPPPSISKDPTGNTVCPGVSDTFSVTAAGTGTLSYQWKKNDAAITGATGAVFILASVVLADSGHYTCVVSNEGGKTTSKAAKLTVNSVSTTPSGNANPATVRLGDSTLLSISTGELGTGASWHWYSGTCGGTPAGTSASIKVSPVTSTSYFVRAEGGCITTNCSAAIPVTVQFTVTFDPKGGSAVAPQYINAGAKATSPNAPTRTGFTFGGWYKEDACTNVWTFATDAVTSNITLYAKWTTVMDTVFFNSNGGTAVPMQIVAYNTTATQPSPAPTRTGYIFAGWYSDAGLNNAFVFTTPVTATLTLYAKWTTVMDTVIFNSNGGTSIPMQIVAYNTTATQPSPAPTRTGYNFAGWYSDVGLNNVFVFTTPITATITLYAKWTTVMDTVFFNSNGGTAVPMQIVAYNTTATQPSPAPTRTGYIFAGWYSDAGLNNAFVFTTPVTATLTLYAKWTQVFTVTYNGNGNTGGSVPVDANQYTNGQTVTVLDNTGGLVKTGYSFACWNTNQNGTGTDRNPGGTFSMGSSNVVLYAKWTPETYTVTFNGQGATVGPNPATKTVTAPETTVGTLPTPPTKTSYLFAGWWTAIKGGGTEFTASTTVTSSITVYANWVIKDIDGNIYTEVTIGTQTWLVENLKTTKYNNGTAIPLVTDNTTWANLTSGARCWYNNDMAAHMNTYGALYNWFAVNTGNLAPAGWHVATDEDWTLLTTYIGGEFGAGKKLKEAGTTHWASAGGTNDYGFTALPGGCRDYLGVYANISYSGFWWSTTAYSGTYSWYRKMNSSDDYVNRRNLDNQYGFSVRCVKD